MQIRAEVLPLWRQHSRSVSIAQDTLNGRECVTHIVQTNPSAPALGIMQDRAQTIWLPLGRNHRLGSLFPSLIVTRIALFADVPVCTH